MNSDGELKTTISSCEAVGIADMANVPSITIYPNPVSDILMIDCNVFRKVKIYDMYGRFILNHSFNRIDVSNLNSGLYVVLIENEKGESIGKSKFV
ncbi:MAG: T9SS type A sorting domain-containing protein [Flavobacteriales bacterium]